MHPNSAPSRLGCFYGGGVALQQKTAPLLPVGRCKIPERSYWLLEIISFSVIVFNLCDANVIHVDR